MKIRGKHNPITPEEKNRIMDLFSALGNKHQVARMVGRSKFAIQSVLKAHLTLPDGGVFSWKDYNNSIII